MTQKPQGFTKFVAWASAVIGLYFVAAPIFGVFYLVAHGSASKASAYIFPLCLGAIISIAGIALLKGLRWSRYLYLLLSTLSVISFARFAPTLLILFGGASDPAAKASLLFVASMAVSSAKWVLVSFVITFVVFRHFHKSAINPAPTLADLTRSQGGV
jgi:hypothetical protein